MKSLAASTALSLLTNTSGTFSRRLGFCEHYAAAFATLARGLGIPARVILGYQGGTYNLSGDFWKIAQKDAHAWTEVLVNDQWQRWDPTQWVSPLRITLGGEKFFSLSEDDRYYFHILQIIN